MTSRPLRLLAAAGALACCALAQRSDIPTGPWAKNKIPAGWVVHLTKNYQIQSQVGVEKAKRLGEHMEALNLVYRRLFRPDKGGVKQQVIKIFQDRQAYLSYDAPPSSAAYFSRSAREMVCYDTGKWSDEEVAQAAATGPDSTAALRRRLQRYDDMMRMDILGCAAHEGWHQYFSWLVVSVVILPSWINEGMGDYFYTAKPHDKPTRRDPAALGGMNYGRLMVLKAAIRQNRYVPVPQLIKMSKSDFYANASVCYAEGWALCHFLLHSGNKRYEEVIPDFIRLVSKDTNLDAVTDKAFKGIDLEQLDREFRAFIDTMKLPKEDEEEVEKDGGEGEKPGGGEDTKPGGGDGAKPGGGDAGTGTGTGQ